MERGWNVTGSQVDTFLIEIAFILSEKITHSSFRYRQVNDIQTAQLIDRFILLLLNYVLSARHRLPFTKCPRTKLAIVNRSRQMPAQSEQIPYYAIHCKKALSLSR